MVDYRSFALEQLGKLLGASGGTPQPNRVVSELQSSELSMIENARLQRAFFRFEIYRKAFALDIPWEEYGSVLGTTPKERMQLAPWPIWE